MPSTPTWIAQAERPALGALIDDFALFAYLTCHVADRTGTEVRFIENPMQRRVNAIEDEMRRDVGAAWLYQLKMRRGGLSTNTQLRNLWRTWRRPHTRGVTLAHEDESTNEIFQITRLAADRFPPELSPPRSRERQRAVTFPGMGSRFFTGTAGAVNLGRGSDYSFLHISEFAFVPKPKQLHSSASQALRKDGTYILETTASSYLSEAHVMWQDAKAGRLKFRPVFFPWWWRDDAYLPLLADDELDPLADDEQELVDQVAAFQLELAHWYRGEPILPAGVRRRVLEQLKWRRDKTHEIGPVDFDREYPKDDTSCWLVAGTPYFDSVALRWMRDHAVRAPLRREWNDELRIYAEPDVNKRYVMGADPSEGVEGDRSAFTVLEYGTWDQVAAFSSRTVPPEGLADRAATIGRRYASAKHGAAVMVPEVNAAGHTMLYQLLRVMRPAYPKSRIWHHMKQVRNLTTEEPGWRTTEETKYIALDEGAALIRESRPLIHDQETVEDLLGVQRGKTGKVELTGRDCAVAWLLAYQGRKKPIAADSLSMGMTGGAQSEAAKVSQKRF